MLQQGISGYRPDWLLVIMFSVSLQNRAIWGGGGKKTIGWSDPSFYIVICPRSSTNLTAKVSPELGVPDFYPREVSASPFSASLQTKMKVRNISQKPDVYSLSLLLNSKAPVNQGSRSFLSSLHHNYLFSKQHSGSNKTYNTFGSKAGGKWRLKI